MIRKLSLFIFILLSINFISAQDFAIIPLPMELSAGEGHFILDSKCILQYDVNNTDVSRIGGFLSSYIDNMYGLKLKTEGTGNTIQFKIISRLNLGKEGYLLKVSKNAIIITASEPNGLFYGMQTLKQMLPVDAANGKVEI